VRGEIAVPELVLAVNAGSSSLKCAVFARGNDPQRVGWARVERIGHGPTFQAAHDAAAPTTRDAPEAADHAAALQGVLNWLAQQHWLEELSAVGHRVVHGGPTHWRPERVTPELIADLRRLSPLDPDHLPGEIALLEACCQRLPKVPQVACFDTAFHHDLPRVAQLLPVPRTYLDEGVRRYGFHGLSYQYLLCELERIAGPAAAHGRVILAHLGSGASLAAVRDGRCLDTTMAFTPTAGVMMGTRCGDIDPGLLIYLLREKGLSTEQLDTLVNKQSGLLGVSSTSNDVRDLLARRTSDHRAAEALELFCYQIRKTIGAYAAVLGGVDTLVFSAGIGENVAEIRAAITTGLDFLGVSIDPQRNREHAAIISPDESRVAVRVIKTDEERLLVRETQHLLDTAAS
jgi:acetate kinase